MKKQVAIAAVSLLTIATSFGVADAKYPPLEDVKPDKKVSNISFDRTPKSVPVSSRPVSAPVENRATTTVNVPANQVFTPVIPSVGANVQFRATIKGPNGKTVDLPRVTSNANGTLRLSSLAITAPGTYVLKITSKGTTRTVRVVIP
jgi:hypothetical protein